jgi:hypothetical protein
MYSDVVPVRPLHTLRSILSSFSFNSLPSCEEAGATRLNSLNLGLAPCQPLEACGELGAVEVESLAGLYGSEGSAGSAANLSPAGIGVCVVQRAMLLGLLAVGSERLWQRLRG